MAFITDEIISEGGLTGTTMTVSNETASRILSTDSDSKITSLDTATYPTLTELTYVKGVTSGLQTQLNGKQATLTNPVTGTGNANELTYFTAGSTISSLTTATYPDLTELSYVKGVSSGIQTQLGNKVDNTRSISTTAPLSGGGNLTADRTFSITQSTTSTDGYLSSTDWNTFNNKTRVLYNAAIAPQAVSGNAEAYLTNSNISTTTIKAGTTITWVISCTKTNAGTAQPVWRVKFGTASSTADSTLITFTGLAQTAAIDTALITIQCVFRSVGSGVSAILSGHYNLTHNLATTGFATLAANNIAGLSGGFNSTTANSFLGISVNPGASAVWTVNQLSVNLSNIV